MELETIHKILKKGNNIVFGPGKLSIEGSEKYSGRPYIKVNLDKKEIIFTSDTIDYLMHNQLERVFKMIYNEFRITEYKTIIHIQTGENQDKDIIISFNKQNTNWEELPEIIQFIQDNFYKVDEWNFCNN